MCNDYITEKAIDWLVKTADAFLIHQAQPVPGSVVYCNLALVAEHTGIYVGNGEIVHLDGEGHIAKVSAAEFCQRLNGRNPSFSIFCPVDAKGQVIGSREVAERALAQVGKKDMYNLAYHNCHCFVTGCLLGDEHIICPSFTILEELLKDKFGFVRWRATNLNH